MTREEWKTIMSVYELWLTDKEEAATANLQEAARPDLSPNKTQKKVWRKRARTELDYALTF
jgi:hypothetical protein